MRRATAEKKLAAFRQAAAADGEPRNLKKSDGVHDESLKGRLVEGTDGWQCGKGPGVGSV